jgi:hypothetical protein
VFWILLCSGCHAAIGLGGPVVYGGGGHGGDLRGSDCTGGDEHAPAGGGGASYHFVGGKGSNNANDGSAAYGDSKMRSFFLGSGGGGGSAYRHSSGAGHGGYGGTGGGAVMIFANRVHMAPSAKIDMLVFSFAFFCCVAFACDAFWGSHLFGYAIWWSRSAHRASSSTSLFVIIIVSLYLLN